MGLVNDVRIAIRDTGVPPNPTTLRFSEPDLTSIVENCVRAINLYAGWSYTIVLLDAAISGTPTEDESVSYHLSYLLAQVKTLEAEASNPDDFVKISDQDTVIDPGDAGTRLAKIIKLKQDEFLLALKKLVGLDHSRWLFVEQQVTF